MQNFAAGRKHACALLEGGQLACWGSNALGQLGDDEGDRSFPVLVPLDGLVLDVDAGEAHTCALLAGGRVYCWGRNTDGRLGDGSEHERSAPTLVARLDDAVAIAASFTHSCALREGGKVSCWGSNTYGQLGDGGFDAARSPSEVRGVKDVQEISAGGYHTCARMASGQVSCWGRNDVGQLGIGNIEDESVPTPRIVEGLSDAIHISAGSMHTCALRAEGSVVCWGWNFSGQLGDGTLDNRNVPTLVPLEGKATSVSAGRSCCPTTGEHTCAVLEDGRVFCWGDNLAGQLGHGTPTSSLEPRAVSVLTGAREVSCGSLFSCALHTDEGALSCWGFNDSGQLGDGSVKRRMSPVRVETLE